MVLFSGIMLVIIFFALILYANKSKGKKICYCIFMSASFLILLIISGCRAFNIGTDTPMFVRAYYRLNTFQAISNTYTERFELGYRIMNAVLNQISNSPHLLLFVSALITLALFYYVFHKQSKYPAMSVFMFVSLMFYCNSMCLLRQYLAMAICSLAIMMLNENKKFKFTLLVLLASLFHSSAIIVLILLPMMKLKITKQNRFKLCFLSIIVMLLGNQLITVLIKVLPQYTSYLSSEKYYLENQLGSILKAGLQIIMFIIINMYFKDEKDDPFYKVGYLCALIATDVSVISIQGAVLERMGFYFSVINCISIPNVLSTINCKRDKYIISLLFILLCLAYYFVVLFLRPYWSGVIPYVFWN